MNIRSAGAAALLLSSLIAVPAVAKRPKPPGDIKPMPGKPKGPNGPIKPMPTAAPKKPAEPAPREPIKPRSS